MQFSRKCYLGLGSNLQAPIKQILAAYEKIKSIKEIHSLAISSLYESLAMTLDNQDNKIKQPNYINAVVSCITEMQGHQLLNALQSIEDEMGRVRDARWDSRVIDIDILLMEDVRINTKELAIPHPGLLKRPFVLLPLAELEPNLVLPNGMKSKDYVGTVSDDWNTKMLLTEELDSKRAYV